MWLKNGMVAGQESARRQSRKAIQKLMLSQSMEKHFKAGYLKSPLVWQYDNWSCEASMDPNFPKQVDYCSFLILSLAMVPREILDDVYFPKFSLHNSNI